MNAAPHIEAVAAKPKRNRRSHPKVKTGCLTCKYVEEHLSFSRGIRLIEHRIRRKKCDETHPACKRCTDTGRKCDGYSNNNSPPAARPFSSKTHLPTPPSSNSGSPPSPKCVPSIVESWGSPDRSTHERDFDNQLQQDRLEATLIPGSTGGEREDCIYAGNDLDEEEEIRSSPTRVSDVLFMPLLYRSPPMPRFSTEREAFCFSFFRERTGPEFSGFFDSSFWSGYLLQACYYHPAVQQAVIALGAVHRRLELGLTPEAFKYCDFALRAYTRAVSSLQKALKEADPGSLDLSIVVSMLFCAFETFQGNYDDASKHMVSGLKILFDRKLHRLSTTSTRISVIFSVESLHGLFSRLELLANDVFEYPANREQFSPKSDDTTLPDIPAYFNSLENARDVLFKLVHSRAPFLTRDDRDEKALLASHQDYVAHLFEWSCVYAEFFMRFKKTMSLSNSKAGMLLRVYREAAYLVILIQPTPCLPDKFITPAEDPDMDCNFSCNTYRERQEVIQAHFAKINSLADSLADRPYPGTGIGSQPCSVSSFSVDDGILPPLYLAATKCRSTKVRHQATSLLSRTAKRGQVWGKLGVYAIAERLSAMEEGALSACGFVPAQTQTTSMDVTVFLEERRFLMRYCIPDREDGSLTWTQDWVAF